MRSYDQQIKHDLFTPPVMSAKGGLGGAGNVCIKRIASLLAGKWDLPYLRNLSCKLRLSLLRSAIQCIRGSRSACYSQRHPPFRSKLAYPESDLWEDCDNYVQLSSEAKLFMPEKRQNVLY